MHMCFSEKKKKTILQVMAFLKLFHVELSQNDRFVIQFNTFLLPYVLALNLIFFLMLDIVFFFPKIYDKMMAFLNL